MNLQILSPDELEEKLKKEEELKKKKHIRNELEDLIKYSLIWKLESAVQNKDAFISREISDVILSEYLENFPQTSLKALLEEKGWKVFELNETNYGISK